MHATNYVTQEQRNQIVKEYFSSGLTRKEFCQQKEISLSSLYRWKMDYKDEQTGDLHFIPLVKRQKPTLLPLEKQSAFKEEGCSGEIRIELGNLKFFIKEQNSLPLLKQVLKEVKELAL